MRSEKSREKGTEGKGGRERVGDGKNQASVGH